MWPYFATPLFEENGIEQLREIVAQNINHPSVLMWGLFSRLRPRGDDMAPYIRRLNDTAHAMDPSRPTVALSDQDGEINFVTDLIVWKQTVGWNRGTTDDVAVWRDQLRRSWSHLRSGVSYGGSRIHRPQELYGAVRAAGELDARGPTDALPRGVCT